MIFLSLLFGSIIWQEEFINNTLFVHQFNEYTVNIQLHNGCLYLKGNPEAEGFSCAWFYLDRDMQFTEEDILEIYIRVIGVNTRLKYFYKKKNSSVYWGKEIIVQPHPDWQKIKLPLNEAEPFYSSNFPFALTPGKTPALYFFIDNFASGNYETEIDYISIIKSDTPGEEQ